MDMRLFSLALDESTDVTDLQRMCVFARFVHDFIVKEDILALIPLSDTTRGIDCYNVLKSYLIDKKVPLAKLCCVITDGAPAMLGTQSGFVFLMKKTQTSDDLCPITVSYIRIVHVGRKMNLNLL